MQPINYSRQIRKANDKPTGSAWLCYITQYKSGGSHYSTITFDLSSPAFFRCRARTDIHTLFRHAFLLWFFSCALHGPPHQFVVSFRQLSPGYIFIYQGQSARKTTIVTGFEIIPLYFNCNITRWTCPLLTLISLQYNSVAEPSFTLVQVVLEK